MSQQNLSGFGFFSPSDSVKRKLEVELDSESAQKLKKKFRKNLNQDSFDWYICEKMDFGIALCVANIKWITHMLSDMNGLGK